ncbi:hypothetical protein [Bacillus sp. THAF10]|uniref:hypothetical protein n=1 Tax=Bacillus sp. THAF10 TaxID=2587848 RepID=UPI0015625337|nr:hypothetical protein [Bacillus sp. THAF10]
MDERTLLAHNKASLKMIRNNLQVYAAEADGNAVKNTYHESMMKIDTILSNIDQRLQDLESKSS